MIIGLQISRTGFLAEFQSIAPPHARAAAHDIEDCLKFSVMVRPGLGIGIYDDRTGPQFGSARQQADSSCCLARLTRA
jgi:hypothetical protein